MCEGYKSWLPELVIVDDIANNWDKFIYTCYNEFVNEYLNDQINFKHYPVHYKRHLLRDGKHGTFYHLITSDNFDNTIREEHFDRLQRINWSKAIIENHESSDILIWENERKGITRICLYLIPERYIVILEPKKNASGAIFMLLWTAYVVTEEHRHRKTIKEFSCFKMADAVYL